MSFTPGYGETPVPDDELDALLPEAHRLFEDPITKAAVYDFEQAIQDQTAEELLTSVLYGRLTIADLLSDLFIRDLHRRLYGDVWTWAGVFRRRELNIGVDPEQISVELRASIGTIRYRWEHVRDWDTTPARHRCPRRGRADPSIRRRQRTFQPAAC
ncbi:MAG: hypothetical protein LKI24_10045 [Acidipropionibacterium sp.]|jgi:fido (protein-threonine AMPylation protein)|nr:hypothetical protein [Acidipropionibacterium sp.]